MPMLTAERLQTVQEALDALDAAATAIEGLMEGDEQHRPADRRGVKLQKCADDTRGIRQRIEGLYA